MNFGVQRELWRNTLLEILYTGNRGLRLLQIAATILPLSP